jgi:hypothetical protein
MSFRMRRDAAPPNSIDLIFSRVVLQGRPWQAIELDWGNTSGDAVKSLEGKWGAACTVERPLQADGLSTGHEGALLRVRSRGGSDEGLPRSSFAQPLRSGVLVALTQNAGGSCL